MRKAEGYPLDDWFDGDFKLLYEGNDFEGTARDMRLAIGYEAHLRGYQVKVKCNSRAGTILLIPITKENEDEVPAQPAGSADSDPAA